MPTLTPAKTDNMLGGDYARRLRMARIQQGVALYKMCEYIRIHMSSLREVCNYFVTAGYPSGTALAQGARVRRFAFNDEAFHSLKQSVLDQEPVNVSDLTAPPITRKTTKKKKK